MVTIDGRPDLYYRHNYGTCRLRDCRCIDRHNPRFDGAWGGLACPDWVPIEAQNMEELIQQAKDMYKNGKNQNH